LGYSIHVGGITGRYERRGNFKVRKESGVLRTEQFKAKAKVNIIGLCLMMIPFNIPMIDQKGFWLAIGIN
jgi:hypothetical protein